jgi:hypothetical protein
MADQNVPEVPKRTGTTSFLGVTLKDIAKVLDYIPVVRDAKRHLENTKENIQKGTIFGFEKEEPEKK